MVKQESLKKNVKILSGFAFSSSCFNNDSLGLPLIRIRDVKRGYSDTYFNGEYNPNFLINNGDILIGMDGEFNVSRWNGGLALLNQRVCKINSADDTQLDEHYLLHYLPKQLKIIERNTPAVTVKHLSVTKINEIKIPLPSIEVQKYIAEILDRAEALKQKRQQALALADEYLRATFLDLFGDPITNPKGWGKQTMIQVCDFENGDRSSKYPSGSDLVESGILFLNTKNIVNGFLSFKETNFITEQKFSELSRGKLQKNDLVITLRGTLANCAIFDCKYNTGFINAQIMIIRPHDDKINSVFLHALINSSPIQSYLKSIGQGAAVPQLTASQLKSFEVMVPPKTEQIKFEQIVKKVEALKAKMQTSETEIEHLAKSLSQKAFRGELVK
ncbi:restriction endonuclease subunit S [Thiomicrorhabdus sp. Milos-T2]|uniref:restriction endonuclease subunit S n=1 Tax=Thiomicrorhabdus sp. Milos-T2 TaxID=90814 RepID=UPI0004943D49|nr:restriction endonuclease subunit S [Thiomicrorhabdus sp. Milos-T2]